MASSRAQDVPPMAFEGVPTKRAAPANPDVRITTAPAPALAMRARAPRARARAIASATRRAVSNRPRAETAPRRRTPDARILSAQSPAPTARTAHRAARSFEERSIRCGAWPNPATTNQRRFPTSSWTPPNRTILATAIPRIPTPGPATSAITKTSGSRYRTLRASRFRSLPKRSRNQCSTTRIPTSRRAPSAA